MTTIKQLPSAVYSSLRSSVVLFDLSRVVEELIYNSIDAGAAKVNVAISVGECYVKVEDDGCGITRDGLGLLGERYATSKPYCLAENDTASKTFGFRGEALSSLSDVSLLEVTTKARGRPNGYRKVIKGCKCLSLGIDADKQEMGTTVVVRDLFYNQPVRRKHMQSSPKKVLHSVKKCALRVALVHPHISFRVTDIKSGDEVLHTHPSTSPLPLVNSGFGIDVSRSLRELKFSNDNWMLAGYISSPLDTCSIKAFQYVYINSQFVCKGPIHKLLNNLADSSKCLDRLKVVPELQSGKRSRIQANPAYILNLHCPRSSYDLNFAPSNTTVEFKDWVLVLSFIEEAIGQLWRQIPAQGKRHGSVDKASRKNEMLKDDGIFSPIPGIFSEDLFVEPEITTKKHRTRPDQNFLQQSSFSLEMAFEESDPLLHPKKYKRTSEALPKHAKRAKEKHTDYFQHIDYASQDMSPTSRDTYVLRTTPVISRKHSTQLRLPGNIPSPVEDNLLFNELTGGQTSEDDVNYNLSGSRWGSVEFEATMNEKSVERLLTSSFYDPKNEVASPPRSAKGLMKPFLQSCSLLGNASALGSVFTNHQKFELGGNDKCRAEGTQLAPDSTINIVGADDSDQNLDIFPKTYLQGIFAAPSPISSISARHEMTDLNVPSTDLRDFHSSGEASFTEESDSFTNSLDQFAKSGLKCLSTRSDWSPVSPYSVFGPVAPVVDDFTEYAPNRDFLSCRGSKSSIFRDGEIVNHNYAKVLNSSNKKDPTSNCTSVDVDYEYSKRYVCRNLFPGSPSSNFSSQKVKSFGETTMWFLDSFVTDKADNCAKPTTHITSPCYHEDCNPRKELDSQKRGLSFHKERSRRSLSAPPFYKGKSKVSTIYNCTTTTTERGPTNSPNIKVTGELKHLTQVSVTSQHNFKQSAAKDFRLNFEQSPSKDFHHYYRTSNKMMQYNTKNTDQVQGEVNFQKSQCNQLWNPDLVEDLTSNEVEDFEFSGLKWRDRNQHTGIECGTDESHNLPEENDILDISSGILHLSGGSVVPESISKDCLKDAKVLQQLDKKYIPVVAGVTLAVIDQHAADERIRLEELRHKVLSGEGKSVTYLDTEQEMVLPEIGYQLLQSYAKQIQNWGWICNVHAEGSGSFTKNLNLLQRRTSVLILLAVPCILGVNLSDKDLLEFLEQLAETDGSSTLPPSVIRVLNFKACRGAIMFGDALLPSECSLIIEELKQTSLCFQCAHGRPTTIPLVNLNALHKQLSNLNNWNGGQDEPWHGLHQHRPNLKRARQRLLSAGGQCK